MISGSANSTNINLLFRVTALVLALPLLLSSCGGGGGGAGGSTLSGSGLTVASWDQGDAKLYAPLSGGDRWSYVEVQDGKRDRPRYSPARTDFEKIVTVDRYDNYSLSEVRIYGNHRVPNPEISFVEKTGASIAYKTDSTNRALFGGLASVATLRLPIIVGEKYELFDTRKLSNTDASSASFDFHVQADVNITGEDSITTPVGVFPTAVRVQTAIRQYQKNSPTTLSSVRYIDEWFVAGIGRVRYIERNDLAGEILTDYLLTGYSVGDQRNESVIPTVAVSTVIRYPNTSTLLFSEKIDPTTVTWNSFSVKDSQGNKVEGRLEIGNTSIRFTPNRPFVAGPYQGLLTKAVEDLAGNALAEDFTWEFTILN